VHGMDLASGVSVRALGVQSGEHVLDLCAAPGNKLCALADLLRWEGSAKVDDAAPSGEPIPAAASSVPAFPPSRGSVTGVDWSYSRLAAARTLTRKYCGSSMSSGVHVRLFLADGQTFAEPPPAGTGPDTRAIHIVDLTQPTAVAAAVSAPLASSLAPASLFHHSHAQQSAMLLRTTDASHTSSSSSAPQLLRLTKREKRAMHKQAAREAWQKRQRGEESKDASSAVAGAGADASDAATVASLSSSIAPSDAASSVLADPAVPVNPALPLLYDRVLVDAECTHDGSLRHTDKLKKNVAAAAANNGSAFNSADAASASSVPAASASPSGADFDWRTLHSPARLSSLQTLQRGLLLRGFQLLRPGGTLVYSTCSMQREQNEEILLWLLQQESGADAVHPLEGIQGCKIEQCPDLSAAEPGATSETAGAATSPSELSATLQSSVECAQFHPSLPVLRYTRVRTTSSSSPSKHMECGMRMEEKISGTSGLYVAKLRKRSG
jgi:16S rRNA C967 or C1407 C5-methylase (RsmB/RsmF family)